MEVLTLDSVIQKVENINKISVIEEKINGFAYLEESARISAVSLGYTYSFILESIKTIIKRLSDHDCAVNYEDTQTEIYEFLKVLYHMKNNQ